ncbi:MAG: hypothetical protein M3P82_06135, partial [Bacteroidota bacterium]|nr:hypothetical protein [Bacteroidota bacterium]
IKNSGKNISLRLFETGRVFSDDGKKFTEEDRLLIALSGRRDSEIIYGGENDFDLFDIKGEAEMFLFKLNLENFALFYYYDETLDGAKIDIRLSDEVIGNIYKADSSLKKEFEIESNVFIAEFYLDRIFSKTSKTKHFQGITRFPSVKRDLAIVVDSKLSYYDLKSNILKSGGELLKSLLLFDLYEDKKIGENKKSLAFTLEFSSNEKTLTDEETNKIVIKIINSLEKNLGATLRT